MRWRRSVEKPESLWVGRCATSVLGTRINRPRARYLRNIVTQIFRRWDRPKGTALTAEVAFVILRDGTVREIRVLTSSRSYSFDLEAQGAVEAAGSAKAFGPLPQGYGADYLQVSFMFKPRDND